MIILASNSPRRKELLAGLLSTPFFESQALSKPAELERLAFPVSRGTETFEVLVIPGIDESYPDDLPAADVAEYIAAKKAVPYKDSLKKGNVVITADTVVVCDGDIMGKPRNEDDAYRMLRELSGKTHQVYTGVCLTTDSENRRFTVGTDVTFKELSDEEIWHYIREYKPFDKAGAYGIQEWIGYIGITGIKGSYYNVMGLPVQRIYEELRTLLPSDKKS